MKLKKPKFWDYKKPNTYAYILSPFSLLVNIFNQIKIKKNKKKFKIKTICIGNIYIGGTGKTSLSIKIHEILNKKKIKSCFIKKFYNSQKDEQKILSDNGKLFLSHKRIDALRHAENENYEVAILDDGLQDQSINYDASFVCFNNLNWIGNGMIIPAGPLRESILNLKKYEHIFLNGNLENLENIKRDVLKINPKINIHIGKYTGINLDQFDVKYKYLVFSGIGNHGTFISMLKKSGLNIFKEIEFPDHYSYTSDDIDKILDLAARHDCKIITTEKDHLRIDYKYQSKIKFVKSELRIINEEKFFQFLTQI